MAKTKKQRSELLLPAATGWERWTGPEEGPLELEQGFEGEGAFTREGQRHTLALPASSIWVLPAWLKGDAEHLGDMAALHLERLGVRMNGTVQDMQIDRIDSDDAAHLTTIIALKDEPAPLSSLTNLPDDSACAAHCLPLPEDAIVVWRELGRLVLAITSGARMIYFSPLSSTQLDDNALSEINNICLQLGFQRVLGSVHRIVIWSDDGDVDRIRLVSGITTVREEKPAPHLPARSLATLMPADISTERARQQKAARTRMMALSAGGFVALAIAVIAVLTMFASRERTALLDKVAELTPRASKVEDHRKAWEEIASAVDPKRFPMEIMLRCMEPKSSGDVALVHFEMSADRVLLRGRTPSSAIALQYTQEIKGLESLNAYTWETPPPQMHSDDSATFELKGTRP
ncbi:MAG: hypothetical protein K1X78_19455 [Verrucomicrobiaceae bacterium]|nr:hypothetical protein [Verrucomicrobiaceae bacterium]